MPKHRLFLAAPDADRAAFRARMLSGVAPALLAAAPALAALSLNLVDATPAVPPWQRPGEAAAPAAPAFDAVFDVWGDDAAIEDALRFLGTRTMDLAQASVRLDETVEKNDLPRPPGQAVGVKFLSLMTFKADLPAPVARRLWAHHAGLALRVHVGMARYVRDWVIGAAPAVPFHGIAELHFPSVEAMTTRWFDSESGRDAIIHDVGHFLDRATRLYTTEHVLKV